MKKHFSTSPKNTPCTTDFYIIVSAKKHNRICLDCLTQIKLTCFIEFYIPLATHSVLKMEKNSSMIIVCQTAE